MWSVALSGHSEAERWKSRGGREPAQHFHLNVTGSPLAASDTLFTRLSPSTSSSEPHAISEVGSAALRMPFMLILERSMGCPKPVSDDSGLDLWGLARQ